LETKDSIYEKYAQLKGKMDESDFRITYLERAGKEKDENLRKLEMKMLEKDEEIR